MTEWPEPPLFPCRGRRRGRAARRRSGCAPAGSSLAARRSTARGSSIAAAPRFFVKTNARRAPADAGGGGRRPARARARRGGPRAGAGRERQRGRRCLPRARMAGLRAGGRDAALGSALAELHRTTAKAHGWHRDNTIGTTPQDNAWTDDWATFFRDRRIAPQLALAARNGHGGRLQRDGEQPAGGDPGAARRPRARGIAAARRSLVRQRRATRVGRAGDLRSRRLLRRPRRPISR